MQKTFNARTSASGVASPALSAESPPLSTQAASALNEQSWSDRSASAPLHVVIKPPASGLMPLDLRDIWQHRELLYFLIWRELKVRYKQTAIGMVWVLIQPLTMMVIFAVIFGRFAQLPSDGRPYAVFALAALVPWTYFSQALIRSGLSLVSDANLLQKVYFPRLIVPISAVIASVPDFAVSFVLLLGMLVWFHIAPSWGIVLLPFFLLLAIITAVAVGLWLSALNVRYRDVGHILPILTQVWMYASPVVYPISLVPESWRIFYGLNPMVGVIEGFRWGLLATNPPDLTIIVVGTATATLALLTGLFFFKRMEPTFADIA